MDEALEAVAEGLEQARETSARFNEAELYRLKGELLVAGVRAEDEDAAQCFRQALEMARPAECEVDRAMRRDELEPAAPATGQARGRATPLAEVHAWFTEGFDTADLKEARALLDALATD